MTSRAHNQILIVAAVVLSLGGVAAILVVRSFASIPNLDQIRALARARQFHQAQVLLDRYLQVRTKDDLAHLLMAQLTTEPTNPQPGIALEHLGTIQTSTSQQTAMIKFLAGKALTNKGV